MKNIIADITKNIVAIKGNQFVSLTYLSKKANELSRFVVNIGFSYHNLVEKSVTELEILMTENAKVHAGCIDEHRAIGVQCTNQSV